MRYNLHYKRKIHYISLMIITFNVKTWRVYPIITEKCDSRTYIILNYMYYMYYFCTQVLRTFI